MNTINIDRCQGRVYKKTVSPPNISTGFPMQDHTGLSAIFFRRIFLNTHRLLTANDIACACRVAVLNDLEFDAAYLTTQYLINLDRFHN